MAKDLKIPYLKALQGYLWTRGYEEGALVCPLFADVEPKLKEWHSAGKTISKYLPRLLAHVLLLLFYPPDISN